MNARQRDKFSSLKRRRVGKSVTTREPQTRRKGTWRTKRPAGEIPPLHPHALYRPGRLCVLFDIDKSTLTRWVKKGLLPPYTEIAGVKGLTGQQILDYYASQQRREERCDV